MELESGHWAKTSGWDLDEEWDIYSNYLLAQYLSPIEK